MIKLFWAYSVKATVASVVGRKRDTWRMPFKNCPDRKPAAKADSGKYSGYTWPIEGARKKKYLNWEKVILNMMLALWMNNRIAGKYLWHTILLQEVNG